MRRFVVMFVAALTCSSGAAVSQTVKYPVEHWRHINCSTVDESVRVVCRKAHRAMGLYDEAEGEPQQGAPEEPNVSPSTAAPDDEKGRKAVDQMLAASLKDPTSPIQYSVTRVLPCTSVLPPDLRQKPTDCICYAVNAKNSWGAYGGVKLGAAELLPVGETFIAMNVPTEIMTAANSASCAANLVPRDASFIKDAVK